MNGTKGNGWRPTGLILDLDGTLLDRNEVISARVIDMLRRISDRVPVAIASGREPADVARFARDLRLSTPQISDNGARILDPETERTLEQMVLHRTDARRILATLESRELKFFAVDSGRMARTVSEIVDWQLTVIAGHTVNEELSVEIQATEATSRRVSAILSKDCDGVRWYVNFTRAGADKGSGVRRWSRRTGTAMSGLVFVGDSYNDLHAFELVGMPVAMGSAPDEVKQAAKHVVSDVYNDGVAEAVERFILPYL